MMTSAITADVIAQHQLTPAEYQKIVDASKPGDILAFYCYDPTVAQRSLVTVVVD